MIGEPAHGSPILTPPTSCRRAGGTGELRLLGTVQQAGDDFADVLVMAMTQSRRLVAFVGVMKPKLDLAKILASSTSRNPPEDGAYGIGWMLVFRLSDPAWYPS